MKERYINVINCPQKTGINLLESRKIIERVTRFCTTNEKSSEFFMVGKLATCLEDCVYKKLVHKELPIINCPIESMTFPITVERGYPVRGTEEHFSCNQTDNFVQITFNSPRIGNGLAVCGNSENCKIQQIRQGNVYRIL